MPALGNALSFNDVSSAAYEQSLHKIEAEGKRQSLIHEKEALSSYDPITLEGSTRKINADERNGDGTEYGMMVGMTVKNPRLRAAQNAQMDAMVQTIGGSQELQKGLIRVGVKREYLLSSLGKESLAITEDKKKLAEETYALAVKKFAAGRISQMELVRFETERDVSEKEYREWEREIRKHQDVLREQTMMDQEIVIDDLAFGFIQEENSQQQIDKAPVLKQYELSVEELDRSIEILRRSTIESVNIGVGMTQEPTQNSVDLRVTIPLAIGNKNEKKIAALMAQRSSLVHQKNLSTEKLRAALNHSFSRLNQLQQMIQESSNVEKRHEALYQMAKKGFEGGVVGLFEYLETRNRFYGSRMETLRLKRDYTEEVAAMEEKMGGTWE